MKARGKAKKKGGGMSAGGKTELQYSLAADIHNLL